MTSRALLDRLLSERIALLDGAMGTMIQRHRLEERDFRGDRFAGHRVDLKGNYDVLVLTRPDVIGAIHRQYLDAGADMIETNTFNANAVSQSDYALEAFVYEINLQAARLARSAVDECMQGTSGRQCFVAGSVGPTNRTLSILPGVSNPASQNITFDEMRAAYVDQIRGLVEGGVDLLLVETVTDALNAKAAIAAIQEVEGETGVSLPLMISVTIIDRNGRTLAGQTLDAFYLSIEHAHPWAVAMNCGLGAAEMRPFVGELARIADCWVGAYPNAGLPNAVGEYDQQPDDTAALVREFAESGFVNLLGGCCGTTPDHIAKVREAVASVAPRPLPPATRGPAAPMRLSGLGPLLTLADARANHLRTDWDTLELPVPWFVGRRVVEPAIETLIPFIDWTFFFAAWELKGRFPAILDHPDLGGPARKLYDNAQAVLARIAQEKRLTARGVYGFWPANTVGDDVVVYRDDSRRVEAARFYMLRQQEPTADGRPNCSLADFVAPRASLAPDYLGAFAVTAGIGAEDLAREYERAHDDYNAIITKALADRLAEAFAEYLHAEARRDWGYGRDERLSSDAMIAEQYRGIRPAFGYPACPDHSEKATLFNLLDAPAIGITLTESFAMMPPASVSGLYLSHPEAKYFNVGRVDRDQIKDYAARKSVTVEQAERWVG